MAIKTLFSKTPQPFRVQGETRMATWEELQAVKAQCDLCRADFRAAVTKLKEQLEPRKVEIAERRITLLEEREAKVRETLTDPASTSAEKEARMKEIFGL